MERCLSGRWCNIGNVVYGNVPQVRILSSPPKPENPAFYAGFLCFGGEGSDEGVPCGSRVGGKPTYAEGPALAWETALSCPVITKKLCYISPPRILCGIFCVSAERTEMKRFLVVRVSALPTYAEGPTLAWETALSCPIVTKKLCRISPPRILCGIFVLWRRGQRGRGSLRFACRLCRHTPRVPRLRGKRRYPVRYYRNTLTRILCGIFCVLTERTEMKRFLVVRVSALPTYAEAVKSTQYWLKNLELYAIM